jgi:hypothetical protein
MASALMSLSCVLTCLLIHIETGRRSTLYLRSKCISRVLCLSVMYALQERQMYTDTWRFRFMPYDGNEDIGKCIKETHGSFVSLILSHISNSVNVYTGLLIKKLQRCLSSAHFSTLSSFLLKGIVNKWISIRKGCRRLNIVEILCIHVWK